MLEFFFRVFGEVFLIIGGVEHALIFEVLFRGCQHGVGERVSQRGAVKLSLLLLKEGNIQKKSVSASSRSKSIAPYYITVVNALNLHKSLSLLSCR